MLVSVPAFVALAVPFLFAMLSTHTSGSGIRSVVWEVDQL